MRTTRLFLIGELCVVEEANNGVFFEYKAVDSDGRDDYSVVWLPLDKTKTFESCKNKYILDAVDWQDIHAIYKNGIEVDDKDAYVVVLNSMLF